MNPASPQRGRVPQSAFGEGWQLAALALPALTMLAWVQRPALVIESSSGDVIRLESWTATLSGSSTEMRGTASLSPGNSYRETLATITLYGAAPRAQHAWYVQMGECRRDVRILAEPQPYLPIEGRRPGQQQLIDDASLHHPDERCVLRERPAVHLPNLVCHRLREPNEGSAGRRANDRGGSGAVARQPARKADIQSCRVRSRPWMTG
jgi:hypothetical protein